LIQDKCHLDNFLKEAPETIKEKISRMIVTQSGQRHKRRIHRML
jgi:hypothetical protein